MAVVVMSGGHGAKHVEVLVEVHLHLGAVGLGDRNALNSGTLVGLLLHLADLAARHRLDSGGACFVSRRPGHIVAIRVRHGYPQPGCREHACRRRRRYRSVLSASSIPPNVD